MNFRPERARDVPVGADRVVSENPGNLQANPRR